MRPDGDWRQDGRHHRYEQGNYRVRKKHAMMAALSLSLATASGDWPEATLRYHGRRLGFGISDAAISHATTRLSQDCRGGGRKWPAGGPAAAILSGDSR